LEKQIKNLKGIFGDLFAKLVSFALEDEFEDALGESLAVFYNLEEGEEYEFKPTEEFLFLSWFLFDDTDSSEKSLVDEFLQRFSDQLSLQEMQICKALKETHLSLMEVLDVNPGKSIFLKDIFLGEEFETPEAVGSEGVIKGSILFSRVLRLAESRFLVGAGIFLSGGVKDSLTQYVTDQYALECEAGKPLNFRDFLKNNGEIINWWIRAFEKGVILNNVKADSDT